MYLGDLSEKRSGGRYKDYARIDAPDLCVLPAMLLDISKTAAVSISISVEINKEDECKLIYASCKQGLKPFSYSKNLFDRETNGCNEAGFL